MFLTIIIMVFLFLFIGLSFLNPFRSKTLNGIYKVVMYCIPCCLMMAPMFFYYGLSDEFSSISIGKTTIVLFEEYERGGEGPSESVCRMHILNKQTGEKTERFYAGYSDGLIGMKGDSVCYKNDDEIIMYDAGKLQKLWSIAEEDWGKHFPELNSGIESMHSNAKYDGPRLPYINITAKNGNKYWVEPFSKKLLLSEPKKIHKAGFYSKGYEINYQDTSGKTFFIVSEGHVQGSGRKKILTCNECLVKIAENPSETFLEPKFFGIDTATRIFVFAHYVSTDKKDFTVEAKDFSSKTVWKKTFAELEASDSYSYGHELNVYATENGIVYFNVGGYVLAIEMKTGKIKWKTRL